MLVADSKFGKNMKKSLTLNSKCVKVTLNMAHRTARGKDQPVWGFALTIALDKAKMFEKIKNCSNACVRRKMDRDRYEYRYGLMIAQSSRD